MNQIGQWNTSRALNRRKAEERIIYLLILRATHLRQHIFTANDLRGSISHKIEMYNVCALALEELPECAYELLPSLIRKFRKDMRVQAT